ncbi:IS2 transposase TnpB (plasmid) [Roseovarius sp. THAF27]|uniref:IS481 family transposase n=1 Tax=unclassified Roseovarius TaxID=2614913 RepID=UPI0012679800|nr:MULTISPECIES: IS481 family transposase [unclassified Roseovarius]QFT83110.1 IS2 transposase TnpB [Roseovarius sp. THAF27]QFT99651.1 IS2 transposase TnpB [Roseovarius sp. THAF8]
MNNPHQGARLTVHSRELIVARHAAGRPARQIAEEFGVSVRTIHKWLRRYREGGHGALGNGASAPVRRPGRLGEARIALILDLRRRFRMAAAVIAERLGLARSTVARWLARHGVGRRAALDPPPPVRRYQRERPGELIHIDIKKLGRFDRPGHRVTGSRTKGSSRGAGWDFVHVAVDDATRLAYVEVLPDERKESATAFLGRARAWFAARGIKVERVMTDNGSCYRSRLFRQILDAHTIRHIRTRPYTPKTNGKAERFIQTLIRDWAYGATYASSAARNSDLTRWLDWFNLRRPHSALNGQAPTMALNNHMRSHN